MKIVSFEVAKYLKEAGYPQGNTEKVYLLKDYEKMKENWVIFREKCIYTDFIADMPTYFDVWLWLWREKNIYINVVSTFEKTCVIAIWKLEERIFFKTKCIDIEDALISAIEYLVENDLIK